MKLSGSCLCGAVGFRLEGWVSPIQACHAERCRKATGALYAPEIAASSTRFEWVGDTDAIASYEAPILREPPAYKRNFCARRGSPLPVVPEDAGYAIIHAGILDGDPALQVFRHAFTGQQSPRCDIADAAPQYAGQPPPPDPTELTP